MPTRLDTLGVPSGSVIQTVHSFSAANASGTTSIPDDTTTPQITEGTELLTATITPKSSTSYLVVQAIAHAQNNTSGWTIQLALFRDSTVDAVASTSFSDDGGVGRHHQFPLFHRELAGSTASTTFRLRIGNQGAGTWTSGGLNNFHNGRLGTTIIIWEVAG